jgi:predicted aspartyl protease
MGQIYYQKIICRLIMLFAIIPFAGFASDNPNAPTSTGSISYSWTNNQDSITIPLRQVGRIFLIEADIDGEKGFLVFDTGASGLVLNKTYFRDYAIMERLQPNGITGSVGSVEKVTVDNISLFGLQFKRIIADMTNLGHIENRRGGKILGLFGFSLIKDFEIVFKPSQNQLQLFRVNKEGNRLCSSGEFLFDYRCKFEVNNSILFLRTIFHGKSLRFCLDTGAETNVIDRHAPKNLINSISITRRTTLHGVGSTTSEVLFGTMSDFQLGDIKFSNMETIITNLDALSEAYDTKIDGMLGYSFLSKGIICINFVKREFSISMNKADQE